MTGKSFEILVHKLYIATNSAVNTRKLFQTLINVINLLTPFNAKQETETFCQILWHKTKLLYVILDYQIEVTNKINVRNKITLLQTI